MNLVLINVFDNTINDNFKNYESSKGNVLVLFLESSKECADLYQLKTTYTNKLNNVFINPQTYDSQLKR